MKIQQTLWSLFILTLVLQLFFLFGNDNQKAYNILYWIQVVLVLIMILFWMRENNILKKQSTALDIASYLLMLSFIIAFFWTGSMETRKVVFRIQYVLAVVWALLYIRQNNHWRNWSILSLLLLFVILGETKNPNQPDKPRFYATMVILVLLVYLVSVQARAQVSKRKKQQQQKNQKQKKQQIFSLKKKQ